MEWKPGDWELVRQDKPWLRKATEPRLVRVMKMMMMGRRKAGNVISERRDRTQ